jgi:PKD repeat protein
MMVNLKYYNIIILIFSLTFWLKSCGFGESLNSKEIPKKAPDVSLSANPTKGQSPLLVNFSVQASDPDGGKIISLIINFGDGYSETLDPLKTKVSHIYFEEGEYTAEVKAVDDENQEGIVQMKIFVLPANQSGIILPPSISFFAKPLSGEAPLVVTFSISATDPDGGNITKISLNFGDGESINLDPPNPVTTHIYKIGGKYVATLSVVDDELQESTSSVTITVFVFQPPIVSLSASFSNLIAPTTIYFTVAASDPDGKVEKVYIDFGDGVSTSVIINDSTATVSHQYTQPGRYKVVAIAIDEQGLVGISNIITLNIASPLLPDAPSNLTVVAISGTEVKLSWKDNSNNEDGFKIQRRTDAGIYSDIATSPANTTSFNDTGLSPNTTYWYRVYAYNSYGNSSYSNEVSITTPP